MSTTTATTSAHPSPAAGISAGVLGPLSLAATLLLLVDPLLGLAPLVLALAAVVVGVVGIAETHPARFPAAFGTFCATAAGVVLIYAVPAMGLLGLPAMH